MVDFNNETTITRPKSDTVQYMILENQSYAFDALEEFYKQNFRNSEAVVEPAFKARVLRLYSMLLPTLEDKKYDVQTDIYYSKPKIDKLIESDKSEDIVNLFRLLNKLIHDWGISRFLSKKDYDPSDPTEEDEEKEV